MRNNEKGFIKQIGIFVVVIIVLGAILGIVQDSNKSKTEPNIIANNSGYQQNPERTELKDNNFQQNPTIEAKKEESKIVLNLLEMKPDNYNEMAKAYSNMRIKYTVTNNYSKDVEAFKGSLEINDIFGKYIDSFQIKEDSTLKAGETKTFEYTYSINLFKPGREDLFNLSKWKSSFVLEDVILSK